MLFALLKKELLLEFRQRYAISGIEWIGTTSVDSLPMRINFS